MSRMRGPPPTSYNVSSLPLKRHSCWENPTVSVTSSTSSLQRAMMAVVFPAPLMPTNPTVSSSPSPPQQPIATRSGWWRNRLLDVAVAVAVDVAVAVAVVVVALTTRQRPQQRSPPTTKLQEGKKCQRVTTFVNTVVGPDVAPHASAARRRSHPPFNPTNAYDRSPALAFTA
eukprot:m.287568 g.287568  ORF g.287568 m.287568 type:complete len:172 (+) comp19445_c0_seq4:1282-1797(+)